LTDFPFSIQKQVLELPNSCSENPDISVIVLTYNQENYIQQCIEGILNQKTEYTIEIVIGEDASTDQTRLICEELAKKYPSTIRVLLHHSENKVKDSFGNPTGKFNLLYTVSQCRGKYIAICEGDDYWTNEYKIQKQIDFLEQNSDFVAVFTDYDKYYQESGVLKKNVNSSLNSISNKVISNKAFFSKDIRLLRTLTSVYRADVLKKFNFIYLQAAGDTQWIFFALQHGKIMYFHESTGVYRIQQESTSKSSSLEKKQRFLENYAQLLKIIKAKYPIGWKDRRYIRKTIWIAEMRRKNMTGDKLNAFIRLFYLISYGFVTPTVFKNYRITN
jgi:glycosyltransferase involved in cell wall biosynthesis